MTAEKLTHGGEPAHAHAQPDLTNVVIVAADSGDGLLNCVAAVLASTVRVDIVVVDNASCDGSIERLQQRFSDTANVRVLHNGANLGFGTGCNLGAAAMARVGALLFLNPDCMIGEDAISCLRQILDADAAIGVVGALQLDSSGRIDPASRRHDPLLRRALATLSGLARVLPATGVAMHTEVRVPSEDVDAISGALMLLPRSVFERVGGFDEGYFLHCEDLDLSRRVRDAGYRVVCATATRVVHAKGGSSRRRPVFVAWHKHRGMWRWFKKFDPAARNSLLRVLVWTGIWGAFAAKLPLLAGRRAFATGAP